MHRSVVSASLCLWVIGVLVPPVAAYAERAPAEHLLAFWEQSRSRIVSAPDPVGPPVRLAADAGRGPDLLDSAVAAAPAPEAKKAPSPAGPGYSLDLPTVAAAPVLDITMKEAVAAAIDSNHDIVIEKITTGISRTQIEQEEGTFDPSVKVGVSDSRSRSEDATGVSTVTKAAKGTGEVSKTFSPGTKLTLSYDTTDNQADSTTGRYQSNLKLSVTQDLLKNFGTDINRAKIRIAEKGFEQASADYGQKIVDTVADVQAAYWDLYRSRETLAVRKHSFELTRNLLMKKRIEAGLGAIATIDLVEIESEVATKITDYTEALKQVRDDEIKLRALLALPMAVGSDIPRLNPSSSPLFRPKPFDYGQILAAVLSVHRGYQSILREKEAKQTEVAYYRNQMRPGLQAKAAYGLQNQSNTWNTSASAFDGGDNYEVGLEMTMPIGNRAARAVWRKSVLELKKIEARLKQKEDTIRKEIGSALVAVEQAALLVESSRMSVQLKEKNLSASEKKLQFGTGSLRALLDRQTDLVDAQLKLLQSEVDYQKAVANLYKAQGIIDPVLEIEISTHPSQEP